MPAVVVDGLTVNHGELTAVDHVSFELDRGHVLALIGPNGAGKTTTIETLEGLRRPTSGRVRVLGLDPAAEHEALMPRLGVMPQDRGVYPDTRPLEMLRLVARFHSHPEDPIELLERAGLTHRVRSTWRSLSGGEQQRLSLVLALVGRPEVVLLDEPTAGIDVAGRQLVRQLVGDLRTSGRTVIITTHDLAEAEKVADHVVIIDRGRVVANGTPSELMRSSGSEEIRFAAPAGLDTAALGKTLMAAVEEVTPGQYVIAIEPTPSNINALTTWLAAHDLPLSDLRAGRLCLEDVFLRMTAITGEIPAVRVGDHQGEGSVDEHDAPESTRDRRPHAERRAGEDRRRAGGSQRGGSPRGRRQCDRPHRPGTRGCRHRTTSRRLRIVPRRKGLPRERVAHTAVDLTGTQLKSLCCDPGRDTRGPDPTAGRTRFGG